MGTYRLLPRILSLALVLGLSACALPGEAVAASSTTRVSVSSAGVQGNAMTYIPSVSDNGRYIAFASDASNLVPGDTYPGGDAFVRDRCTGATTLVSVSSAGVHGDGTSSSVRISADGRYVVFTSYGDNLVPNDTNATWDLFVRDRILNTTARVSVSSSGVQSDGFSYMGAISDDGRYVAFPSDGTGLVSDDTNGVTDIFVRDRVANTTTRVSVSSGGVQADGGSSGVSISADGRYIAFQSNATNLVLNDTNGVPDIFVRDRVLNTTTRVSLGVGNAQAVAQCTLPSISADGRYIAFQSAAALAAGDTNGLTDVFVRDRNIGATARVSVSSASVQGDGPSYTPQISADGRYVAFESDASNLAPSDTNGVTDVFLRDRTGGVTTRISVDSLGKQGNGSSGHPDIGTDGRFVAFSSEATDLIAGDTNAVQDIFVYDATPSATSITIKTTATSVRTGAIPILSGAVTPKGLIGWNIVAYVKKPGKAYFSYSSNRTVYNLGGNAAWQYKYYFKPGMVKGYYIFKAISPAYPGLLTCASPTTVSIRLR